MNNHFGIFYRLSLQFALEIPRQLHFSWHLVSNGCRLGQRLRWLPFLVSFGYDKTATTDKFDVRIGRIEGRPVDCS